MTDPSDTQTAPASDTPVESTANAPAAPPAAATLPAAPKPPTMKEVDESIKKRLEWAIAGKEVNVNFKGTKLTFRRWGLRQNLQMGSRVIKLVNTVNRVAPEQGVLADVGLFTQVLSYVANDVIEIIAASLSSPFPNSDAAEKWLDESVDNVEDLFDLAYVVYEQNLKGEGLGKLVGGMEGLTKKMASLSMSSSKS